MVQLTTVVSGSALPKLLLRVNASLGFKRK